MVRLASVLVLLFVPATLGAQDTRIVRGTVLDDDGGAPVRGARVYVPGESSVFTDARGRFSIAVVRPAPIQMVQVIKSGYARSVFGVGAVPGQLVVRLRRAGVLSIRLFDEFNAPKRGSATVTALPDTGAMMALTASLDENGELRVPNLPPGRYRVQIGGVLGQLLRMPSDLDAADVGRVRDEIRALAASQASGAAAPDYTVNVRSGDETVLALVDASPGLLRPVIDVTGERAALVEDGRVDGRTGTAVLTGRVAAPDGRPIANARVHVTGSGSGASVTTDTDGRYTLDGLPEGTFRIRVTRRSFMPLLVGSTQLADGPATVTLAEGERREVDALLSPASTVSGLVLDEHGDPLDRARVLLLRAPEDAASEPPAIAARANTDERGRYSVRGVPPGTFYVFTDGEVAFPGEVHQFYPGQLSLSAARPVTVEWGFDLEEVTIRLNRALGTRITGTALAANGTPLAGRALQMTGRDVTGSPIVPRVARTNRAGAFEFGQVPQGEYEISFQTAPMPVALVPALLGWTAPPGAATGPLTGSVVVRVGESPPPAVTVRAEP